MAWPHPGAVVLGMTLSLVAATAASAQKADGAWSLQYYAQSNQDRDTDPATWLNGRWQQHYQRSGMAMQTGFRGGLQQQGDNNQNPYWADYAYLDISIRRPASRIRLGRQYNGLDPTMSRFDGASIRVSAPNGMRYSAAAGITDLPSHTQAVHTRRALQAVSVEQRWSPSWRGRFYGAGRRVGAVWDRQGTGAVIDHQTAKVHHRFVLDYDALFDSVNRISWKTTYNSDHRGVGVKFRQYHFPSLSLSNALLDSDGSKDELPKHVPSGILLQQARDKTAYYRAMIISAHAGLGGIRFNSQFQAGRRLDRPAYWQKQRHYFFELDVSAGAASSSWGNGRLGFRYWDNDNGITHDVYADHRWRKGHWHIKSYLGVYQNRWSSDGQYQSVEPWVGVYYDLTRQTVLEVNAGYVIEPEPTRFDGGRGGYYYYTLAYHWRMNT